MMAGGSVSLMFTLKAQPCVLPEASRAKQVTVVTPFLNVDPLADEQTTVAPGQLSVTVAV